MNKQGIVLVVSMVVLAVVLILTGVYFSSLIVEKRAADTGKYVLQALDLAEAGVSHGRAELKKRIAVDLVGWVESKSGSDAITPYLNNSLGLLQAGAGLPAPVNNEITLTLNPLELGSQVLGGYSQAQVSITPNGLPTADVEREIYVFPYNYSVSSSASVQAVEKQVALTGGAFTVTITRKNFARYALFTFHHRTTNGITVWFTNNTNFTGPVNTNERFSFAGNPSGHFTEDVTQSYQTARFFNDRGWGQNPVLLDADYNSYIDQQTGQEVFVDKPVFDKEFKRGQPPVVLDTSLSQSDLKKQALAGSLSNEPASNGIYVINDGTQVTGGIYIKGSGYSSSDDAIVSMNASADGPVYNITCGSVTKVISVNYNANQTSIQTSGGGAPQVLNGVPDGNSDEGILIYSNDKIKSFSGTVERNTEITLSGEKDIVVTNHVQYQDFTPDDPATTQVNELSAIDPATSQPYDNVLGIISWGGNVRIGNQQPSGNPVPDNIQIHAVVMAPNVNHQSAAGVFTVDNYDTLPDRGVATLLGGAITDYYGAFGTFGGWSGPTGYGRNFVYDARMLSGKAPPYFPYMKNFTSSVDDGIDKPLTWEGQG